MAPEVMNNQPYNDKVDIFSFGVILRLLLTGVAAIPLQEPEDDATVMDGPTDSSKNSDIEPTRPVPTTTATSATAMQLLIDHCAAAEFYLRPSSTVIIRHIREEMEAMVASISISKIALRWGVRQGKAISKMITTIIEKFNTQ
eukprot:gene32541-42154_t